MKEFYTQCMKDLFALTGIDQVQWMLRDLKDGERNFDLCVQAMVQTSKAFPYIPEEAQKKIIKKMMIEDKEYEGLNSRTIYKWLNMFRDAYFTESYSPKETPRVELTVEESERIDKLANEYLAQLSGGMFKPQYSRLEETKEAILKEDAERVEGHESLSTQYAKNLMPFLCYDDQGDCIEIPAKTKEDASRFFKMNFGFDPVKVEAKI